MSEPIKTKIIDSILEVTIDRPKANAIDAKTSIILGNIFSDFRDNPNLKVAIILRLVFLGDYRSNERPIPEGISFN